MNKGYILIATNKAEQEQAATAAYSLKIRNTDAHVTLIVPYVDAVYEHLKEPFDNIEELPFDKDADGRLNDWQLYWASPYNYTMVLDTKVLIEENHDELWEYLIEHKDLAFPTHVKDFKGKKFSKQSIFKDLEIKPVEAEMWYFKKSDLTLEYFKLCDPFIRNWESFVDETVGKSYRQTYYHPGFIHSLIVNRMWNKEDIYCDRFNLVSMQPSVEVFIRKIKNGWMDYLNHWVTKTTRLKVQNYNITGTFAYISQEFLTQETYERHRDYYRYINK